MLILILLLYSLGASSALYYYLHVKTNMNLKLMLVDNLVAALIVFVIAFIAYKVFAIPWIPFIIIPLALPVLAYCFIQLRFWRSPNRIVTAKIDQIVSPADGNVIYINHILHKDDIIAVKGGQISSLVEISQSELIPLPCWQIGINMTPFDVHKNCSPMSGKILLSKHIMGQFHSLKDILSLSENERHTYVISNDKVQVGVIQIASKRVRRIDSYVQEGQDVAVGDWIGMIRFGSQVDLLLPERSQISVKLKEQVYARKTIMAELL